MKTVFVSILMTLASLNFAAADSSKLAQKYLDLAEELSLARANDQTCDVNASEDKILDLVYDASWLDGYDAKNVGPNTRQQMAPLLGFREVMKTFDPYDYTTENYEKALVGTFFNSPPMGVFGSLRRLKLLANGKLLRTETVLNEDATDYKIVETVGTWKVQVKQTSRNFLVRVALILPDHNGKMKTVVLRLGKHYDSLNMWILHTKVKPGQEPGALDNVEYYNQSVDECEV